MNTGTSESPADGRSLFDSVDARIERVDAARGRFSLTGDMIVERGSKSDWDLLSDLHYKGHNLPPGPRFWRLALQGRTIGVLVTGTPKGLLKERHLVFPKIKLEGIDTKLVNTERFRWVNNNFRLISRFVVDTMYRGIGAGYRMMNLVSRLEGPRFMEIQSSMSKFNLFGQKAGFEYAKPSNSNKHDVGMKFFRQTFDASPQDFEAIVNEIGAMSPTAQSIVLSQCKAFYYKHSPNEKTGSRRGEKGVDRVEAMTIRETIQNLQQLIMASPLYGLYENPDFGRKLPASLPLTAFDDQRFDQPLSEVHVARDA